MPLLTAGPSRFLGGGAKWWQVPGATCVAAYQPKGAADLAASYVNLANPGTYNAAPGVAPTIGAPGWSFNGTTQWLTTGVTLATNMSVIVCFSGDSGLNRAAVGSRGAAGGGTGLIIWTSGSPETERYYDNGARVTIANNIASGILCIAGTAYRDGADETITLANSAAGPAFHIGAANNNGTPAFYFVGTIQVAAIYSTVLSAGDVAALTARMQAL